MVGSDVSLCELQASLLHASKMRLCRSSLRLDDRHVVITPMTLCQHCAKRLLFQQALVTPDLRIMHAKCCQEVTQGQSTMDTGLSSA
jgi:hypothetical protein